MAKFEKAWRHEDTGEIFVWGRIVWPALLVARSNKKFPDKAATFQGTVMIPAGFDVKAVSTEIARAAEEKHGAAWKTKIKPDKYALQQTKTNLTLATFAAEFPFILKASANLDFPPFVIGPDAKPFKGDASDIYSGRWVLMAGSAWGYDKGSNGVGWNLNRVQLLDHAEPIAGGRVADATGFEAATVVEPKKGAGPSGPAKTTDDVFGGDDDGDTVEGLFQ